MKTISALLVSLAASASFAAEPAALQQKTFEASRYSQIETECDRLAAHSDDPFHVGVGKEKADMDPPAAVAACKRDLQNDPGNPRILYQLARSLSYSGRGEEGLPYIEKSASLGYPQALFVVGYLYLEGLYSAPKDPCRAGVMIRESAQYGRMAGQLGFPAWYLEGRFKGCPVPQERAEMVAFLEAAHATKPEFYHELLINDLLRQLRGQ